MRSYLSIFLLISGFSSFFLSSLLGSDFVTAGEISGMLLITFSVGIFLLDYMKEDTPNAPPSAKEPDPIPADLGKAKDNEPILKDKTLTEKPPKAKKDEPILKDKTEAFFVNIKNGIRNEIKTLEKVGQISLGAGVIIGAFGIGILIYFYHKYPPITGKEGASLISPYLPLVVLIEILSIFLLNQFRKHRNDINYLLNELTDIELKSSAILLSVAHGKEEDTSEIIKSFLLSDRNKVYKNRADNNNTNNIIEKLIDKIK